MKAYSQDLRDRVIVAHKTGCYDRTSISDIYNVSYDVVSEWIKRYESTGDYSSKQNKGRGRQPRFNDKDSILRYLKENPDADGIEIRDAVASDIPMSTFYDTLKRFEISFKKKNQNTNKEVK